MPKFSVKRQSYSAAVEVEMTDAGAKWTVVVTRKGIWIDGWNGEMAVSALSEQVIITALQAFVHELLDGLPS